MPRVGPMSDRLQATWDRGRGAVNGWLAIPSAVTAEINAQRDFDSLTIDLQHGLIDYQTALSMLQAMTARAPTPLVRVPWLEPGIIMKLLDAGALGVICPMINTREEAAALVRFCRYAPDGERSFGPTRAGMIYGRDYAARANETVKVLAMIETARAFENLAEIVETEGLSGLYIGPSDLALSFGRPPGFDHQDPDMRGRIAEILQAAKGAGLRAGIHCLAPSYAKEMLDLGFDLVTLGSDIRWLNAALAGALRELRT